VTTLTAPGRKQPIDRHKAIRRSGGGVPVERQLELLADQLWDAVPNVRRLARLEARKAAQTAWMAAHGSQCPDDDYQRRAAILSATEANWAAARVAFLEAAERCRIYFRAVAGRPHRAVWETWRVQYRSSDGGETAYRRQWAWWFQAMTEDMNR
jgi:hypothetical protein